MSRIVIVISIYHRQEHIDLKYYNVISSSCGHFTCSRVCEAELEVKDLKDKLVGNLNTLTVFSVRCRVYEHTAITIELSSQILTSVN
jgi:hypothetical protein